MVPFEIFHQFPSGFLLAGQAFQVEKRFEVGTKSEDSRRGARVWGGNVASFPFLFGSINLSPFLRCFSYHDLEQEGLGGSSAWSDLCLLSSKLCG